MEALDEMISVLCSPDGTVCINGSPTDREIIQKSLAAIDKHIAELEAEIAKGKIYGVVNPNAVNWHRRAMGRQERVCEVLTEKAGVDATLSRIMEWGEGNCHTCKNSIWPDDGFECGLSSKDYWECFTDTHSKFWSPIWEVGE